MVLPTESPWQISDEELMAILEREYGLGSTRLELLNGYDDRNYYVHDKESQRDFLLKVYNEKFSSSPKELEGELTLLTYLRSKGLPVPVVVPLKNGSQYLTISNNDMSKHRQKLLRLQVFLSGKILGKCSITPKICLNLGVLVGQMDAALAEWSSPTVSSADQKWSKEWDLGHLDEMKQIATAELLPDETRRSLALRAVEFAQSKIAPNLKMLPIQAVHGDVNEQNIIMSEDGSEIVGIIDFADSLVTCRVFEPAVALMYWILFGTDPMQCAVSFITGYLQHVSLTKLEKSLLFPCIIGRYAQSLLIGNYTAVQLAKQNKPNDYVLITSKKGWASLAQLLDTPLGSQLADYFENHC